MQESGKSGLSMLMRGLCLDHWDVEVMLTGLAALRFFWEECEPVDGAKEADAEADEVRSSDWNVASQGVAGGLLPYEGLLALADLLALAKALTKGWGPSILWAGLMAQSSIRGSCCSSAPASLP